MSGLTMIAAALVWRTGAEMWPIVLAGVVFVLCFVQAYVGSDGPLLVHVPGAMVLTLGSVLVADWSFTRGAAVVR